MLSGGGGGGAKKMPSGATPVENSKHTAQALPHTPQ